MNDIVQRGLHLQVEAEDLASGTLAGIGDELDALQARAETVFGAMAMDGENAASSLADSAQLFSPEWETQLEAIQSFAEGTFAAIEQIVSTSAGNMAGVASGVSDAWLTALDSLKSGSESAIGSLDGLQSGMESTVEVADSTAGDIASAYSGDALALDAGAGSLGNLQGAMGSTVGVADTTAGEIAKAYSADGLALDAGAGSLAKLDESMQTAAKEATTTAGDIGKAYSTDTLKIGDTGIGSLKELTSEMDQAVKTADADAKAIAEKFSQAGFSTGAVSGEAAVAGSAAGATGAAPEEVSGINFGKDAKGAAKGFKLPIPSVSSLMTGGITGMIGLGAVDIGIQQLEGLEALKAQTGMSWGQTLTTSAAAKGVGLGTDQIQRLIQRLDTNIGKLDQKSVTGAHTVEGKAVPMGFGRMGIDPSTLKAVDTSIGAGGSAAAALALKTLGIGPDQLTGMNAQQQLAVIATKLDDVKNATLRTAVTQELFGRGTDTAFLLEKFTLATTEAQKNLPKGLAADLAATLGPVGSKNMVDLQEQMFYLEVEMSASLMKMVPALDKLVGFGAAHLKQLEILTVGLLGAGAVKNLLDHHLPAGADTITKHAGSALSGAANAAKKAAPWLLRGAGGDAAAAAAVLAAPFAILDTLQGKSKAAHETGFAGGDVYRGAGGQWIQQFPRGGVRDITAAQAAGLVDPLSAAHIMSAGRESFTSKDTISAISLAAAKYHLNAAGMTADSYAESSLNPNAVEDKPYRDDKGVLHAPSYATGAFQFIPSTWASSTKAEFGKALPFTDAKNPYISAMVAAGSMSRGGIGAEKDPAAAFKDDVINFERPGVKGASQDIARGTPFLQSLEADYTKAEASAKTHAPKVKQPITAMLIDIVALAKKHGADFSKATDDSLLKIEEYLKTHKAPFNKAGQDLMHGLQVGIESELPALRGEAEKIASELEATIRKVLKTHSPSEVTAQIGADLMAGMSLGISRTAGDAIATASTESMRVAGALGATITSPGGTGRGEQTIIIQLDGREIGRTVSRYQHDQIKVIAKLP